LAAGAEKAGLAPCATDLAWDQAIKCFGWTLSACSEPCPDGF